jgi:hypothetical protein
MIMPVAGHRDRHGETAMMSCFPSKLNLLQGNHRDYPSRLPGPALQPEVIPVEDSEGSRSTSKHR